MAEREFYLEVSHRGEAITLEPVPNGNWIVRAAGNDANPPRYLGAFTDTDDMMQALVASHCPDKHLVPEPTSRKDP